MSRAIDVARYFLFLASSEEEPTFLSQLHIQKLLYYAQGWHLAFQSSPLFSERLEAWTKGPVVPEVYPCFADYRYQPIDASEGRDDESLSQLQKQFIRSIWEGYKVFSAPKLTEMTHNETPWRLARGDLKPYERSSEELSSDEMRSFFEQQYRHRAIPGLELEKLQKAERDFAQGRGVLLSDVKAARSRE